MLLPITSVSPRSIQFVSSSFTLNRLYSGIKMYTNENWEAEKQKCMSLPLEEKRKLYSNYLTVNRIEPWNLYFRKNENVKDKNHTDDDLTEFRKIKIDLKKNRNLLDKVSILQGDITQLEIDAIVNAANSRLRAGGGVDGAIHEAAGPYLQAECGSLGGCLTGQAKITGGYRLPAKYVIHTVGPQDGSPSKLQSCYENCLARLKEFKLKSIAFPCISTGIYGFPNRLAAHIALRTVRKFLEDNDDVDRIIFCLFMPIDVDIYETLMQMYFPLHEKNYND